MTKAQGELEGFEAPSIPQIDTKAGVYYKTVHKRLKLQEHEAVEKEALMAAFAEHGAELPEDDNGIRHYKYQDGGLYFHVKMGEKKSISVTKVKKPALEVVE